MPRTINRLTIDPYSSSGEYRKFDVVYNTNSGIEYYYVCKENSPSGQLPDYTGFANQYWQPFHQDFVASDIWRLSYSSSVNMQPKVRKVQFRDGRLVQANDGINYNAAGIEAEWSNLNYTESKSLLAYLEYLGGTESLILNLPEPYVTSGRYSVQNWNISYDRWNMSNIKAILNEEFDILGMNQESNDIDDSSPFVTGSGDCPEYGAEDTGINLFADAGKLIGYWDLSIQESLNYSGWVNTGNLWRAYHVYSGERYELTPQFSTYRDNTLGSFDDDIIYKDLYGTGHLYAMMLEFGYTSAFYYSTGECYWWGCDENAVYFEGGNLSDLNTSPFFINSKDMGGWQFNNGTACLSMWVKQDYSEDRVFANSGTIKGGLVSCAGTISPFDYTEYMPYGDNTIRLDVFREDVIEFTPNPLLDFSQWHLLTINCSSTAYTVWFNDQIMYSGDPVYAKVVSFPSLYKLEGAFLDSFDSSNDLNLNNSQFPIIDNGSCTFRLGVSKDGPMHCGWISGVGMWNRSLNENEISYLYNGGNGIRYRDETTGRINGYNIELYYESFSNHYYDVINLK